jgi:murein DD-endopeptidase MepM/ murein hydrolase activator NlpD
MPILTVVPYMARRARVTSIFLLFLLSISTILCGAAQQYHVVQVGETLYSIAKSYSIPYDTLAALNGITDPAKIRPGIVLLIPQVHVVAKGETYYGISKKYDISIQDLKSANNLSDSYILKVGDVLVIPEKGSPASYTATATISQPPAAPASSATSISPSTSPPPPSAPSATPPLAAIPAQPVSPPTSSAPAPVVPSAATNANPKTEASAPRSVDKLMRWPVEGKGQYMSGKLEGIMFQTSQGALVKAVASGTVVSAGPSRGFGEVVFIQSKAGFVYVYGGNESILVKTGETVEPGKTIARVGVDAKEGNPIAYFFVFRNGQPVDPLLAPRE